MNDDGCSGAFSLINAGSQVRVGMASDGSSAVHNGKQESAQTALPRNKRKASSLGHHPFVRNCCYFCVLYTCSIRKDKDKETYQGIMPATIPTGL